MRLLTFYCSERREYLVKGQTSGVPNGTHPAASLSSSLGGINLIPIPYTGFQSTLRVPFHPGLCCYALSALSSP